MNGAQRQSIPVVTDADDDSHRQLFNPPTRADLFAELKDGVERATEGMTFTQYVEAKRSFLALLDARAACAVGDLTIDESQTVRDWSYLWVGRRLNASVREEREAAYVQVDGRTVATIRKAA